MPGRSLKSDKEFMQELLDHVKSVSRDGVTISMPAVLSAPAEVTYIGPCRYCKFRLVLDGRHRCGQCGAPEHLAAGEYGIPFLYVDPNIAFDKPRSERATQGGWR